MFGRHTYRRHHPAEWKNYGYIEAGSFNRNMYYPQGQQHEIPPLFNSQWGGSGNWNYGSTPSQAFTGFPQFSSMPSGGLQPPMMGGGFVPQYQQNQMSKMLFQNPLQQPEGTGYGIQGQQFGQYSNMHPYPAQSFMPRPPSGFQSVLNSFKGQDGTLDINKMANTAGQMVNALTQVSSMFKGLGGVLKI
ncbi:YppG family protein [Mesobacillus harenae]|uniref:YppG family protein n=1 Tax=Mesobacillus harenae TaxID=2213203 RepID=UPI001F54892C|nr:YppG family protein [Mesobacillus harenae]